MSQTTLGPGSPQIVQSTTGLVKYLRDMVRSSRRVIRDTDKFEDVVWLREVPEGLVHVHDDVSSEDGSRILALEYEPRVAGPQPPRILEGWLDAVAVHDPFGPEPVLRPKPDLAHTVGDAEGSSTAAQELEARSHSQQVHDAFQAWIGDWREWSARQRAADPRQRIYERLAKITRDVSGHDDVLEVVLAAGLLVWQPEDGSRIHRHLVTRRLRITIDSATARIDVRLDRDAPLVLEDQNFLDEEDGYRRERAAALHERISACPQHPLSDAVGELIEDWSQLAFDHAVRYLATWQAPDDVSSDVGLHRITVAPAVILRARDRNALVDVYERILTRLDGADAQVPLGLAQLIAPLTRSERSTWQADRRQRRNAPFDEEPLFPLATNPQQRAVLDRLRQDTAAVVQGPPGTGKTHTIANLTAALLAQGLRVLVTSQKEQPLAVLRDMVPTQVRDLCVMVAPDNGPGSGALERTLTALSDRAATEQVQVLEDSVSDLQGRRMDLLRRRAELEEDIRCLREAETLEHEPAPGYRGTLVQIAGLVAQDEERYEWMPKPEQDAPVDLPLGLGLFSRLRDLLRTGSPERTARAKQWFPDSTTVPGPEEFTERITRIEAGQQAASPLDPMAEAAAELSLAALDRIENLLHDAADCLHRLEVGQNAKQWRSGDWRVRALADTLAGTNARRWERIADSAKTAQASLETVLGLDSVDISRLHSGEYVALLSAARTWRDYLQSGRRPRRMFPSSEQVQVEPLITKCTISNAAPRTVEDLTAVITVLEAALTAHQIDELWGSVKVAPEPACLAEQLERHIERARALSTVREFGTLRDEIDKELLANRVRILLRTRSTAVTPRPYPAVNARARAR